MKAYYITGMTCNGCVKLATQAIVAVPGITSVQIDLVTSKALIEMNRDVSFEDISKSLQNTKFTLTENAPGFTYVFGKWFKKYKALILAFSSVVTWTVINRAVFGWNLHFAMHDFMGGFFLLFGGLKVISWNKFSENYSAYDPLAKRSHLYSLVYPAIEVFLGIAYQLRFEYELYWNITTVLILGLASVGIIDVLKRKEIIKCACLGGSFNIPITWFTVFENALMIFMAIYMQIVFGKI